MADLLSLPEAASLGELHLETSRLGLAACNPPQQQFEG
jgi:hypothetical protein